MIFLIDIIIFLSIIFFAVNKTIRSTIPNEFFKLFALIIGILGAKFLYPDFLRSLIINLFSGLFNISENKSGYTITTDLPGIEKKDVDISMSNGMVTISGERKVFEDNENKISQYSSIKYGNFKKSFYLPERKF